VCEVEAILCACTVKWVVEEKGEERSVGETVKDGEEEEKEKEDENGNKKKEEEIKVLFPSILLLTKQVENASR
jgi:Na+/citrate or Na+/malate symporter